MASVRAKNTSLVMKPANASNLSEYKKLSKSERECFGLYRTPEFYEMNGESFEDYWKSNYPIQFTIRNSSENFWITLSVWKDKIIPIAKSPTGETHKARVDKVYSIGVSSILKLDKNKKTPIRIDNIIGLRIIFFINIIN